MRMRLFTATVAAVAAVSAFGVAAAQDGDIDWPVQPSTVELAGQGSQDGDIDWP
jgi:hypothetical protein